MRRNQPIKVHVFVGAVTSVQRIPLRRAREAVLSSVAVEWQECSVARVKELEWRPRDLVQWLQEADIYLIISHIHQGILEKLQWDMMDLRESLQLLYDNIGFPHRNNLLCPVFLQDKFSYITSIRELCNPTVKISFDSAFCRSLASKPLQCLDMISRFTKQFDEGKGWVVKAPYTTNKDFVKFCKSEKQVINRIKDAKERFDEVIPYVMLQPTMANKNEDKVVLVGMKPYYIADKAINPGHGRKSADQATLSAFAVRAVTLLKQRDPNFIADGLVRVDIFCNAQGRLVVNEIESLEANYSKQPLELEMQVSTALVDYWKSVLHRCLVRYTNKRIKQALI
jgi:hypothetical protein